MVALTLFIKKVLLFQSSHFSSFIYISAKLAFVEDNWKCMSKSCFPCSVYFVLFVCYLSITFFFLIVEISESCHFKDAVFISLYILIPIHL